MAKATGFTCDVPDCEVFATGTGEMPDGWMTLVISVVVPREASFTEGTSGVDRKLSTMHICSNKCLGRLAKLRSTTDAPEKDKEGGSGRGNYKRSPENREMLARSNYKRWHRAGKHVNEPMVGCPDCEAETMAETASEGVG